MESKYEIIEKEKIQLLSFPNVEVLSSDEEIKQRFVDLNRALYLGNLEHSKIKKGSSEPNRVKVGSVTWDQVRAIAEDKLPDLNCFTVDSAMRMVAGTARSMGVTVKGGEAPKSK